MPAYNVAAVIRDTLTRIFTIPERELARTICEVLININSQSVNEIHLVNTTDRVLSLIRDTFLEMNESNQQKSLLSAIELGGKTVSSTIEKRIKRRPDELLIHNRVKVFIYCADITKLKVDAIVCPNDENLSCSTGLSRELADLAGTAYTKRCRDAARSKTLKPSEVVSIRTEDYGLIINVIMPHLNSSFWTYTTFDDYLYREVLHISFQNAIKEARKCGVSSLAICPIGAGKVYMDC